MYDCHAHCSHSHDSPTSIDEMIQNAIKKGVKYMAFTDHLDRDYLYDNSLDKNVGQLDLPFHIKDVLRAKEQYASKIEVALGVECGFSIASQNEYAMLLKDKNFDIILNSVHSIDGVDCYYPEFFEGKSKKQAYEEYLIAILNSVRTNFDYDVITHIGYVCRKAPFEDMSMNYGDFQDLLDCILQEIIKKGVSLELNTNNKGTNTNFLPYSSIVDRYIELGGEDFTYGSDAHRIDRICDKFDCVKDYLLSKNKKYLNIYKNRQKIKINICKEKQ